jgi:MFS family permease
VISKWLLAPVVVDFIGTGLVLPFLVIYLHEVRHFPLQTVGVVAAIPAVVGLAVVGPAGALIDRVGPRRIFAVAMVGLMISEAGLAFTREVWQAVVVLVLSGAAGAAIWPAVDALIGTVIPSGLRQRYFGINFTLLNLGIGIGGIISGLVVDCIGPVPSRRSSSSTRRATWRPWRSCSARSATSTRTHEKVGTSRAPVPTSRRSRIGPCSGTGPCSPFSSSSSSPRSPPPRS